MGASFFCLHKNKWWQTSRGPLLDAGAFVAGLEYSTGVDATILGKPSAAYFAHVELKTTELKTVDSLKLNTFRIIAQLESPDAPAPAHQPAPAIQGKGKRGAKPTAANPARPAAGKES